MSVFKPYSHADLEEPRCVRTATYSEVVSAGLITGREAAVGDAGRLGQGVFARQLIPAGHYACSYGGDVVPFNSESESRYLINLGNGQMIDGDPQRCPRTTRGHIGIYINDARGVEGASNNVESVTYETFGESRYLRSGTWAVMIEAKRDIQPGEQLFMAYGDDYWKEEEGVDVTEVPLSPWSSPERVGLVRFDDDNDDQVALHWAHNRRRKDWRQAPVQADCDEHSLPIMSRVYDYPPTKIILDVPSKSMVLNDFSGFEADPVAIYLNTDTNDEWYADIRYKTTTRTGTDVILVPREAFVGIAQSLLDDRYERDDVQAAMNAILN